MNIRHLYLHCTPRKTFLPYCVLALFNSGLLWEPVSKTALWNALCCKGYFESIAYCIYSVLSGKDETVGFKNKNSCAASEKLDFWHITDIESGRGAGLMFCWLLESSDLTCGPALAGDVPACSWLLRNFSCLLAFFPQPDSFIYFSVVFIL